MSVEWNPKKANKRIAHALFAGVTEASMATVVHIQTQFQRPITGKGFTDRTGMTRQSITHRVDLTRNGIRASIISGAAHSIHLEHVAGGKYAYMLPGFLEMRSRLLPIITNRTRRELALP